MFGRMLADVPDLNVDAAVQVAHALSVHAVDNEFDYYTAVDDRKHDNQETGAGMIGTIESATRCSGVRVAPAIPWNRVRFPAVSSTSVSFCSTPPHRLPTMADNSCP